MHIHKRSLSGISLMAAFRSCSCALWRSLSRSLALLTPYCAVMYVHLFPICLQCRRVVSHLSIVVVVVVVFVALVIAMPLQIVFGGVLRIDY